jgi:hypothetical protein
MIDVLGISKNSKIQYSNEKCEKIIYENLIVVTYLMILLIRDEG